MSHPDDLKGYTQCHFFAGIGGWSAALRLAGWPDERPVWTGSCPCQPFSAAGKGDGFDDERHLWPYWYHLIRECRPSAVFGEQVASKAGLLWFDLVRSDMEDADFAIGGTDLCAAGVEAPHIRQRLWFVAHALQPGWSEGWSRSGDRPLASRRGDGLLVHSDHEHERSARDASWAGDIMRPIEISILANGGGTGLEISGEQSSWSKCAATERSGSLGELANANPNGFGASAGFELQDTKCDPESRGGTSELANTNVGYGRPRSPHEQWRDVDWLFCRDGKWRPVEPGTFPLAYGVSGRVGRLRAYGNAIVPQVAAQIIKTYLDIEAHAK